ncbi:aldo/keto reductase [Saccharopolyspora sp. 6T]|uniref:aldo/keto reductase n=1 Tax=Saccharopolyspora sp. 6T TaxID=2877238 RepID=UPI001CD47EA4|nr:aldo/keto reductase [Saccharopolyspora sp. 6T]MCA1188491.1 aldo/keto reductase [Saccharopolyspora sp. 6T]
MTTVPSLALNNGVTMPQLGFGVFQADPSETARAVETALATGYRHIDTAAAYFNEREVGEGIRRSGLDRDQVFVETKVWATDYGHHRTRHAFDKAAAKLGVETIDLLILHQPVPLRFDRTIEAYKGLEDLLEAGEVRAIGVSNFMPEHLERLIASTDVVPAVNQIEVHPYFRQTAAQQANAEHGVVSQAWSPIGGITFYPGWGGDDRRSTLQDPVIGEISKAHGRTPAQVMLRWHLQQGRSAIPKSTDPGRIAENFDVFGFELTAADLARIDALDTGVRSGPDPETLDPDRSPLVIPEA